MQVEVLYDQGMAKKKAAGKGRPRVDPSEAFTCRHLVNISPKMEDAVKRFASANGIARPTDAIRQLLNWSLREKGMM